MGVLRDILSDGDSLAWWARLSRDDDRWSLVPLAPIFSISFWPRLLNVLLRRENVFSRFPFFLSSLGSSLSGSIEDLLPLPFKEEEDEATLLDENDAPPTSSAKSWATLVWRTTSRAWGTKSRLVRLTLTGQVAYIAGCGEFPSLKDCKSEWDYRDYIELEFIIIYAVEK